MNKSPVLRIAGVALATIGIAFIAIVVFQNNKKIDAPLVFADRTMLNALWDDYKQEYWENESGRTLDKQQQDITTSEGQSYTMLRAVWSGDKDTFDKTWEFTTQQLQHKDDALFAWKWGKKTDGTYGVLTDQNGQNAATDGDTDIALALLMAANRWQQSSYRSEAKQIVESIWQKEIVIINDRPYVTANDLENKSTANTAIINPSYLAPYAYRHFASLDTQHDWGEAVDTSYEVIERSSKQPLDTGNPVGLVPDWILIDKKSGELQPTQIANLTTHYSYDAMRTPWRMALDWQWNKEPRAKAVLSNMSFLKDTWNKEGALYSTYSHSGTILVRDEIPAMYGTAIGYFKIIEPGLAKKVYNEKLKTLYDPTTNGWKEDVSYYSDNWAWFGMALYDDALPDLAK